jgi:murein L,D-transpeptidase YcbB/YkuD
MENKNLLFALRHLLLVCLVLFQLPFLAACRPNSGGNPTLAETSANVLSRGRTDQVYEQNYPQPKLDSALVAEYIGQEKEFRHHLPLVEKFYSDRNYQLAWFKDNQLVPQANKLMEVIEKARQEGLNPTDYQVKDLREMYRLLVRLESTADQKLKQQEFDLALTASYFNYASDFYKGAVDPHSTAAVEWQVKRNKVKLNKALETILKERESFYPYYEFEALHEGYQKLRDALVEYRELQERGGWPEVPGERVVELNDTADVVLDLRKRLLPNQRINEQDSAFLVYDREVEEAVRAFQRQHGLTVDGIAGPETYRALNVSVDERIDQIILNMERWRWLPKRLAPADKPDRYVMVNIPAYQLYVMENGEEKMRMKVVVGKTMHSTPIFSHEVQYIVFAPYWNVPNSIVMDEIKPKLQRNRGWLRTQDMEMVTTFGPNARRVPVSRVNWYRVTEDNFRYRIRQRPGPKNALGRVKFIFPNEYAVYLHDTPSDHLFNQSERDFSHGCVRVERPVDLAAYLLRDNPLWDRSRILEAMNGREEQRVDLEESVPVYLVYFTAWVENDGTVHFRDDLYGHDEALAQEFF